MRETSHQATCFAPDARLLGSWIWMSCQLYKVTSGQQTPSATEIGCFPDYEPTFICLQTIARTVRYTSADGNRRATGHKQSRSRTCPMPATRSAKKTALPQRAQTSLLPVSPPLASWDGTWACARCDTFLKQQNIFCLSSRVKCPNARQVLLRSVYNIYIPVAPEPKIPIMWSGGMTNAKLTNSLTDSLHVRK